MAEAINFWDLAYADGDHLEHWQSLAPPPELAAAIALGQVREEALALDVGCGAGAEAIFLASQGFRALGIDSSQRAIEIARDAAKAAGVDAEFQRADVLDLPLADHSIGFAYDRGCLHVIDNDQRSRYASELARVLQPGACLLVCGAAVSDDEEGVVAIDSQAITRHFLTFFDSGPIVPMDLVARSGSLAANLVGLRRRANL